MSVDIKTVKIYMVPLEFPCGPQSTCCGPTGQSNEVIQELKNAIEKELNLNVQVINVKYTVIMAESNVIKLMNTFGVNALPIIALNGEVISMGNASPQEAVQAIRMKLAD